ncbi:putative bifunctional diguanylate cyclase/phosphodiesterase [Comamonas guangdongensis]|uniref:Bifunctional diguanylate cyclase/phosphodiesterase n=1 Tax=Comamonas guangdongensis TaxID=510515 RepID=A0ABV3ZV94_9BURK
MQSSQAVTDHCNSSQEAEPASADQRLALALKELKDLKAALNAHAIVAVTDARGVITQANEKFCEVSRYSRDELIGSTHRIVNSGTHPRSFFLQLWKTISSGQIWNGEICNRAKDGALYWVQTTIVPQLGPDGRPEQYISIRADITQRKRAEEQALHLALHDALTGLANRVLLAEHLQRTLASSRRSRRHGALMLLDLDNFKDVNDRFGHSQGDALLCQIALRLLACVRETDTVARVGGDEFVILLNELDTDPAQASVHAYAMAERLRESLGSTFDLGGLLVPSTLSIGLLLFDGSSDGTEELMKRADMALYQAKERGRNNVCVFDPTLQASILSQTGLIDDLRQAIQRDEFHLLYQPVVSPLQQPQDWEALIRWQHPTRGLLAPAAFIKLAEESGLILSLGQWVLRAACEQLTHWGRVPATAHWSVAVNVSARQFLDPAFAARVQSVIEGSGINPSLLRLELTESMFLTDIEKSILKMQSLRALGVQFALDDFGTGYSSLSYLKRLPLDQLKVDRSFVQGLPGSREDAAITTTILTLARTLGLQVVAEGVENKAQFDFLLQHGCSAFQGYLFGKPMSAQDAASHFPPARQAIAGSE